ncbi:hypothetical protein KUTeg_006999 [Tegillarca granosa]|uniref:Alpha-mannosidase Ams1-like N-terminal domain-containing protein n=1 Tax=Tegillarca granosa TaxID=220873 RepID=A0ABQ9FBZ0_TEGGR|nr:hypothetical protein KUTeg_006999 [Tegillarca granosa]
MPGTCTFSCTMDHIVLKHKRTTLERADKFISDTYFTDVNLRSRLYGPPVPVECVSYYSAPDRISYKEAQNGDYKPFKLGMSFGPTWSTHWFRLDIEIPDSWEGEEVHLLWNSHSEALVWIRWSTMSDFFNESFFYLKMTTTEDI